MNQSSNTVNPVCPVFYTEGEGRRGRGGGLPEFNSFAWNNRVKIRYAELRLVLYVQEILTHCI